MSKIAALDYIKRCRESKDSMCDDVFGTKVMTYSKVESILGVIEGYLNTPEPEKKVFKVKPRPKVDRDKPWREGGWPVGASQYRFTNPIDDEGCESLYLRILKVLFWYGPMDKHTIWLKIGFNIWTANSFMERNQYSGVFSSMSLAKLVKWNTNTRKWELGDNFYLWRDEVLPFKAENSDHWRQ